MFSCSKEQSKEVRELNIFVKSIDSIHAIGPPEDPRFCLYPNPFTDQISLRFMADSAQILIINTNGDMKKFTIYGCGAMLDFYNEKPGVYYCEALINKKVFRTYLIKSR